MGAPAAEGVQKATGFFGHIQQAQQIPPQCIARAASLSLNTFPAIFLFLQSFPCSGNEDALLQAQQ